jgi:hypothetical protein
LALRPHNILPPFYKYFEYKFFIYLDHFLIIEFLKGNSV